MSLALNLAQRDNADGSNKAELRFSVDGGTQGLIIIAQDGWTHGNMGEDQLEPDRWGRSSRGKNIRLSLNGSARMTIQEFRELTAKVEELWAQQS